MSSVRYQQGWMILFYSHWIFVHLRHLADCEWIIHVQSEILLALDIDGNVIQQILIVHVHSYFCSFAERTFAKGSCEQTILFLSTPTYKHIWQYFFRFYYKIHKQIEDFNSRIKQYYNTITISKNIEKKICIKVCLYVHEY